MEIAEVLRGLEASLLESSVRKNVARVSELLAEDFREYGSSGRVFDKAQIIADLRDEVPYAIAMQEFACMMLAEGVALVTYRSVRESGFEAIRSSIWVMRDGRWRMIFHQGTRCK
jgi:hypothetical protein